MISNVERVLKKTYEDAEKKGKKEARLAMARQMIAKNFALSDIAELTGFDLAKLEQIQNQQKKNEYPYTPDVWSKTAGPGKRGRG